MKDTLGLPAADVWFEDPPRRGDEKSRLQPAGQGRRLTDLPIGERPERARVHDDEGMPSRSSLRRLLHVNTESPDLAASGSAGALVQRMYGPIRHAGSRVVRRFQAGKALPAPAQRPATRTRVALWPGASVVSGRRRPIVTKLDDETALVRRRPAKRAQRGTWLVESDGATRAANAKALVDLVAIRDVIRVLDLHRVNCVLDVGANVGQYAQRLRETGWKGRIVSFEPLPSAFESLQAASAADPDWRVMNVALGREDGEATINVVEGKGMMSSLLVASPYGREWSEKLAATSPLTVQVRRLEPLLPDILEGIDEPRVYLKLDTQGYDLEAFSGAGRGLDLVVAMQSEISSLAIYEGMPDLAVALETYRRHGFDLAGCWPVSYERSTHRALEFDAVLVRRPLDGAA